MCSTLFNISLALIIHFINCIECENTATTLNFTDSKGEPCYAQLEKLAKEHCSKLKRYIVGGPSVTWYQAKINCEKVGYKLASITSEEENENMLKQLLVQGLGAPEAWIGLNDLAKEGNYVWASNVNLNSSKYLNWYVGEPNNAFDDEDCIHLYPDGSFNDFNCLTNMKYVCEYYTIDYCY